MPIRPDFSGANTFGMHQQQPQYASSVVGSHDWRRPDGLPSLGRDDIHVWHFDLDRSETDLNVMWRTISADEVCRAAAFCFEESRRRYVAAHAILRHLVGHYTKTAPSDVEFAAGTNDRPFVVEKAGRPQVSFNLSHSGRTAVACFAQCDVIGIDVEERRQVPDALSIAARWFTPREYAALAGLAPGRLSEAFLIMWTRKEAVLKATGEGLSRPLHEVEVGLDGKTPLRPLENTQQEPVWHLCNLPPLLGALGALAFQGPMRFRQHWTWLN